MVAQASRYHEVYRRSLDDPEGFWGEAARDIDHHALAAVEQPMQFRRRNRRDSGPIELRHRRGLEQQRVVLRAVHPERGRHVLLEGRLSG